MFMVGLLGTIGEEVYGSVLVLKNDDTSTVEVIIEPGEGKLVSSGPQITPTLEPGKEERITVTKESLEGVDVFSIKGNVLMPSVDNSCNGLLIDKDYKIIFTGSKAGGIVCRAEMMTVNGKSEKCHKPKKNEY